jgi:hypothetical protein
VSFLLSHSARTCRMDCESGDHTVRSSSGSIFDTGHVRELPPHHPKLDQTLPKSARLLCYGASAFQQAVLSCTHRLTHAFLEHVSISAELFPPRYGLTISSFLAGRVRSRALYPFTSSANSGDFAPRQERPRPPLRSPHRIRRVPPGDSAVALPPCR